MNKKERDSFLVAGVVAIAGIILIIAGVVLGGIGQLKDFVESNYSENLNITNKLEADGALGQTEGSYDIADVKDLDIQIGASKFQMLETDGNQILIETDNVSIITELKDGVLAISTPGKKTDNTEVVVKIPKNADLNKIKLALGVGEMDIDDLKSDKLILSVGAGSVDMNNCYFKDAVIEIAAGELKYDGDITGNLNLECALGNVEMDMDSSESDHNFEISVALGNVNVGSIEGAGISDNRKDNGKPGSVYKIECGAGNVDIDF